MACETSARGRVSAGGGLERAPREDRNVSPRSELMVLLDIAVHEIKGRCPVQDRGSDNNR